MVKNSLVGAALMLTCLCMHSAPARAESFDVSVRQVNPGGSAVTAVCAYAKTCVIPFDLWIGDQKRRGMIATVTVGEGVADVKVSSSEGKLWIGESCSSGADTSRHRLSLDRLGHATKDIALYHPLEEDAGTPLMTHPVMRSPLRCFGELEVSIARIKGKGV